MISKKTQRFDRVFAELPVEVQRQARTAYRLFRQNPYHNSLRFRQVHPTEPIYSARIGLFYRALGRFDATTNTITWFWIGPHPEYERLLGRR